MSRTTTCSQCESEVTVITDQGDICYRCRCGVVGKWWKGEEWEDGPPDTAADVINYALDDIGRRIEMMRTVINNIEELRLDDDVGADAVNAVMRASDLLTKAEDILGPFYRKRDGGIELLWPGEPLELIDAGEVIRAAVAKGEQS